MSLREIALRTPDEPHPDADKCPSCQYFEEAGERYPAAEFHTIARNLARRRAQHIDDGECLTVPDGDE